MTWRTTRKLKRAGGRGFGASNSNTSIPPRPSKPPVPRPTPRPKPDGIPGITPMKPDGIPGITPMKPDGIPGIIHIDKRVPETGLTPIPKNRTGILPGPAPAMGRPDLLPRDHGAWKNRSCFSQGSKNWKPDILSLTLAHSCPNPKGPQSPGRPENITRDSAGYNTKLFKSEADIAKALIHLGYKSPDGNAMIRRFQRHWNLVISRIAYVPDRYRNVNFAHIPQGNVIIDGRPGPQTLNAMEIAIINQNTNPDLAWRCIVEMVSRAGTGYGKRKLYNAAQWA